MTLRRLPVVIDQHLILDNDSSTLPVIVVGSPAWFTWLTADQPRSFSFRHPSGSFTARCERRRDSWYWYAYRMQSGKLHKTYLGKADSLTLERLDTAATALADRALSAQLDDHFARPDYTTEGIFTTRSSTTHLLTTKLNIPRPPAYLVSRPRLIAAIQPQPGTKLTLICAPAGSGKTTLVSEWIAADGAASCQVTWLTLHTNDNDLNRFWTYLIAAVDRLHPGLGADAQMVLRTPHMPFEAVLTVLLNALSTYPTPCVLVLDDYHLISASSIHQSVSALLDQLPPHIHLCVATRTEPPLPLAQLRARGELVEIRSEALSFTLDEQRTFMGHAMGVQLSAEDNTTLHQRTEGWAAGLHLAALTLRRQADLHRAVAQLSGSHRAIADYLIDEVLQAQPEGIQTFMLETAILDRLCAPLCESLHDHEPALSSGEQNQAELAQPPAPHAQLLLEYLERNQLFLVPLDDERYWFRYHQLFADVLRARLHHFHPKRMAYLHHRASLWYEQQGLIEEAIHHALASENWGRAATLIGQNANTMIWEHGEIVTLQQWIGSLPDDVAQEHPTIGLACAWSHIITNNLALAEQWVLRITEQAQPTVRPEPIQAELSAIQAVLAVRQGNLLRGIEQAHEALDHLPQYQYQMRGRLAFVLSDAYRKQGNLTKALSFLAEAAAIGNIVNDAFLTWWGIAGRAYILIQRGQLRQAATICERALATVTSSAAQSAHPYAGLVFMLRGHIRYEWNLLDEAVQDIETGIQLLELISYNVNVYEGYLQLVLIRLAQGDYARVHDALTRAEQLAQQANLDELWIELGVVQAYIALQQGNSGAAAQVLSDYVGLWSEGTDNPAWHTPYLEMYELIHLTQAQLDIAQDRSSEALVVLDRLRTATAMDERKQTAISILALESIAHYTLKEHHQALTKLTQASALAEPEGYCRTFVDKGPQMVAVLSAAIAGGASSYAQKLLAAFPAKTLGTVGTQRFIAETDTGKATDPSDLSPQKRRILHLVAAGLTNRAIAQELVLAENTVKTYLKQIYLQLNVTNRVQAIARAKALQLL